MASQNNSIPSNANIMQSIVASLASQEALLEYANKTAGNISKIVEATKGKIQKDALSQIKLLDACVSSINNIIVSITKLNFKDALTLPMKLPLLENAVSMMLDSLEKIANKTAELKELPKINAQLLLLTKTLESLKSIVNIIIDFPLIKPTKIMSLKISMFSLIKVLQMVCKKLDKDLKDVKISPQTFVLIEVFKELISALKDLATDLITFGKTSLKLLLFSPIVLLGLIATMALISLMIKIISWFKTFNGFVKMIKTTATVKLFKELIKGLKDIMTDLILLAPLGILLILIAPVVILGVVVTLLMINAIIFLIGRMSSLSKSLIKVFITIFIFKLLLIELLKIIGLLFILALAAILMVKFYDIMLLGLFTVVMVLLIIAGLGLVMKLVTKALSMSTMIQVLLFLVILIVLIALIFVAAILLVAISNQKDPICNGLLDLIIVIGIILALSLVLCLLGMGVSYVIPFLVPTLVFIALVTLCVGLILVLALLLKVLAKMEFTKDETNMIKNNVKNIIESARAVLDIMMQGAFGVDNENGNPIINILKTIAGAYIAIIQLLAACMFVALTIVAIALIMVLFLLLKLLVKMSFTKDDVKTIKENVRNIITAAATVIDILNSPMEGVEKDESEKSTLDKIIDAILPETMAMMLRALGAILMLIPIIIAVGLVIFLGKALETLCEVELPDDLEDRVRAIVIGAKKVISIVNEPLEGVKKDDSKEGWLIRMAKKILPDNIVDMITALGAILMLIPISIAVGALASTAQQLNEIVKFNLTGDAVLKKVNDIVWVAKQVINRAMDIDVDEDDLEDLVDEVLEPLQDVIEELRNISNGLNFKFNEENIKSIHTGTSALVSLLTDHKVWTYVPRRLPLFQSLVNSLKTLSDVKMNRETLAFMMVADKFIKDINTVDLKKLETTEKIFKNMAEFSKSIRGEFDELADALNEKIAPLLEELNKGLEKIPNKMDEQQAKQAFDSAPSWLPGDKLKSLYNKVNPFASNEEVKEKVEEKIQEQNPQSNAIQETNELLQDIKNLLMMRLA